MSDFPLDEIFGVDIDGYCKFHGITVDDLMNKSKKDIELLKKRLHTLVHVEDRMLDPVTNEVQKLLNKKEKHLKRLKQWKRSKNGNN